MSVFLGDFLGFTLGNTHSSSLNITRVSVSDRYEDTLIPTFKDTILDVPGGDGMYYFDSYYKSRTFTLSFAYDDLRDEDLRALRQLFGFKGVQQLIFDEFPYKKYMVKCAAPPSFRYICFDHMEMRLYKGEGSVLLIAYFPYALGTQKTIFTNKANVTFNNQGDLPGLLKLYCKRDEDESSPSYLCFNLRTIILYDKDKKNILNKFLIRKTPEVKDSYLLIDNSTHLIEGLDSNYKKTGNLYNKYIEYGDFFSIPIGLSNIQAFTVNNNLIQFSKVEFTALYY